MSDKPSTSAGSTVSEICGQAIAGKFPTNLKGHMRKFHTEEYKEVLKQEAAILEKRQKDRHLYCCDHLTYQV